MYSQTALDTYPELLKLSEEQVKLAAGVLQAIRGAVKAPFQLAGRGAAAVGRGVSDAAGAVGRVFKPNGPARVATQAAEATRNMRLPGFGNGTQAGPAGEAAAGIISQGRPGLLDRVRGFVATPSDASARSALRAKQTGFNSAAERAKAMAPRLEARADKQLLGRLNNARNPNDITSAMQELNSLPSARRDALSQQLKETGRGAARSTAKANRAGQAAAGGAAAPAEAAGKPMGWGTKALLGGGALAAAGGAYGYGRHQQEQKDKTVRNMAFGGGVAAGMAAPHLLRGVAGAANNAANSNFFGG